MGIADKTRKLLWGRSGNRCAICKRELVVAATTLDVEAIVGDECHIVSAQSNGPRHDPSYPNDVLDSCENLILLCRVDHKMVDDQPDTYTAAILRLMKSNHETWVSARLSEGKSPASIRLRRVKEQIPAYLARVTTGRELFALLQNSCAYSFDHEEPSSEDEATLIADFLQEIQDWGDLIAHLETGESVKCQFRLTQWLLDLEAEGLCVFGAREVQRMEAGSAPATDWPVAILHVLRKGNSRIQAACTRPSGDS